MWGACFVAMALCPVLAAQNVPVRVLLLAPIPTIATSAQEVWPRNMPRLGYKVKFVSVTNGDAGHQTQGGGELAKRRRAEAKKPAGESGIEYEVLDNHDGELLPTLDVREQIIREIRQWKADIVHRTTAQRLPSRPSLHRRAGAGRVVHGHRSQLWRRIRRRYRETRSFFITATASRGRKRFSQILWFPSMMCFRKR